MSSIRSVNGRWGLVHYIGRDEYVGRSLHNYGEYNPDETEMVMYLASLTTGKCLDIGANFGVIGQALETLGKEVVYFEPQFDIYNYVLTKNVRGLCHNVGLSDTSGSAYMPRISLGDKCNYGGLSIGTRSALGTITVNINTLDSYGVDDIGFIKIDVEGFEEKVLRGGADTIARCRPIMYIEDDRTEKSASLRSYVTSLGYTIEEHKPTLYRQKNFFGLEKNIWAPYNYASHNIICRPC